MSDKLMVMGSSGFLGSYLSSYFKKAGFQVFDHGFSNGYELVFDATDYNKVEESMLANVPKVLINCIAFADVNGCESQPEKAYLLNSKVVSNISKCIENHNLDTYLIHISTDHLYDSVDPSSEEQITLKNYYAYSKYIGDLYVKNAKSVVLRTNFFGLNRKCPGKGFTEWIYNNLSSDKSINAFNDIYFNPLSIGTLAQFIFKIVDAQPCGIYNLGSRGFISKAEFIVAFAEHLGFKRNLIKIVSSEICRDNSVKRPKNMIMNCKKIEDFFNFKMPTVLEEIENAADDYLFNKDLV